MGQNTGDVNPLALAFLLAMCLVIVGSDRRKAVGALLITAAFIPIGQQIVIAGLHVYFQRILILVGLSRLLLRGESVGFRLVTVDKLFLGWMFVGFFCELLRGPSAETFGHLYDTAGIYFLVRVLTREAVDVLAHLQVLAFLGIAIGVCMAWEAVTHRNPFFVIGGVPEFTTQRGDQFRCQGSFHHPILAGTFGATLFPLLVGYWRNVGRGKWLAITGMIGSLIITVTSASSGPLLTFLAALAGFCLWPMRNTMRFFRRGVVVLIVGLAMVMNAPIWFLIGKISGLTGGGGYYRSYLIDEFVRHFSQWWLIGTSYTANWAGAGIGEVLVANPNMVDITNHYIAQGVEGGIVGLGFFLAMIVACFKIVGRFVRAEDDPPIGRILFWAFGVCLAAHCTAFISISYFDQINVFWFWLLAVIAGAPVWARQGLEEEATQAATEKIDDSRNMASAVLN